MRIIFLCLMALFASSCTKTTTLRHAENYKSSIERARQVLVLPPVVEVNTVDVAGKKTRMDEYEIHLCDVIRERIILALEKKDLRARVLRAKDINDLGLYRPLNALRESYDKIAKDLYKKHLWKVEEALVVDRSVKEKAAIFAEKTSSDILVFIDYSRNSQTSGAIVRDLAMQMLIGSSYGSSEPNAHIIIGFIDAHNGQFVWSNLGSVFEGSISFSDPKKSDIKHIDVIVNATLKQFMKLEKNK